MATDAPATKEPERQSVETLRDDLGTDTATFAGVRVREGWAVGALASRSQYQKAVERFLNGPTTLEKDGE